MPTIRELREAAHLTQFEVADKTGLSLSTVIRLENGTTENPSFHAFQKLKEILGSEVEAALLKKKETNDD